MNYTNVVGLPHSKATMQHVRLLRLDGTLFASAGFLPGDAGAPWAWIRETVAHELSCDPDQVGCVESDDGDAIAIDGLPVYRVAIGPFQN